MAKINFISKAKVFWGNFAWNYRAMTAGLRPVLGQLCKQTWGIVILRYWRNRNVML